MEHHPRIKILRDFPTRKNHLVSVIALTGGSGGGKTSLAKELQNWGAVLIDADKLAREAIKVGSSGFAEVCQQFGTDILKENGDIDRERLANIVFNNAEKLAQLESIIHPRVQEEAQKIISNAKAGATLVYDIPVLRNDEYAKTFDLIILVTAPKNLRIQRLTKYRNTTKEAGEQRIQAQASQNYYRAFSHIEYRNDASRQELKQDAQYLWENLLSKLGEKRDNPTAETSKMK